MLRLVDNVLRTLLAWTALFCLVAGSILQAAQPATRPPAAGLRYAVSDQTALLDYGKQGFAQPTCTGHSAANALQAMRWQLDGVDEPLSGEFVQLQGWTDLNLQRGGIRPQHAAKAILDHGCCAERLYPNWMVLNWWRTRTFPEQAVADALTRRIGSWRTLRDRADFVAAMTAGPPAAGVLGLEWYGALDREVIETYTPSGFGAWHAVALVDVDAAGYVIAVDPRNVRQRIKRISPAAFEAMLAAAGEQKVLLQGFTLAQ
jgi:hypothetical protein